MVAYAEMFGDVHGNFLSPLRGLVHNLLNFPTAYAVGCILSPLRG